MVSGHFSTVPSALIQPGEKGRREASLNIQRQWKYKASELDGTVTRINTALLSKSARANGASVNARGVFKWPSPRAPGNRLLATAASLALLASFLWQRKYRHSPNWGPVLLGGVVTEIKGYAMQVCSCNEISRTYRLVRTHDCHRMALWSGWA